MLYLLKKFVFNFCIMIQQGSAKYNNAAFKFNRLPVELKGSAAELAKAESADCFEIVPFCTSGTTGVERAVPISRGSSVKT